MKPHVICHMLTSIDGRILPDHWHPPFSATSLYEEIHSKLGCDAWLVGRVTGQEFASREAPYPETKDAPPAKENWFAQQRADTWAVVLDAHGKIAWGRGDVDGEPLVVVLTQAVSDSHLVGLRQDGVSYIFAGEEEIDLATVLEALNRKLGVSRLLLEGGGTTNGALLGNGLVDELSLVIVPSVEGIPGHPALFDIDHPSGALDGIDVKLTSCEMLDGDCVWLRYRFSWTE